MKLMSATELALFVTENMSKEKVDIVSNLLDTLPTDQIDALEEFSACCLVGGHIKGFRQGVMVGGLSAVIGVTAGLIYLNHKKKTQEETK